MRPSLINTNNKYISVEGPRPASVEGRGRVLEGGSRMGRHGRLIAVGIVVALLAGGWAVAHPRAPDNVDLTVRPRDIHLEPAGGGTPHLNDVIYVNATIVNNGDQPAFNVSVIFSYNTTDMALVELGRLELNKTSTVIGPLGGSVVASWTWETSGLELRPMTNYSVFVEARNDTQPANQSDVDLTNNIAFANMSFQPDVIPFVQDLTSSTDDAVVGETVTFMATLGNSGIRPAIGERVEFHLDGEQTPFCTTTADIPAGGTAQVPCDWNTTGASDGVHSVTAMAGGTSKSASVSLKYRTNPYIKSITSSSYSARVGDLLAINATVDNNGVETARLVLVDFFLNAGGVPLGNLTAFELKVGEPEVLSFRWDTTGTPTGNHTIKARVAENGRELRTPNITLDVELLPDLEIAEATLSHLSPLVGDLVNITVSIANIGEGAPRYNTTLEFLLDSVETLASFTVTPLGPGERFNVSFDWDTSGLTPVRHTLRVMVNAYNDFAESDEGNNERLFQLQFRGSIDLAVVSINFSLSTNQSDPTGEVTVGQTLRVWVGIANLGSLGSMASTTLELLLDNSTVPFDSIHLQPIAAGGALIAKFEWNTSALDDTADTVHRLLARLDGPRLNNDSDWANNELAVNITVHPAVLDADLSILEVRTANSEVRYLEVLMVTARITNTGGKAAQNFTVRFTCWSGTVSNLIGDSTVALLQPGETRNVTLPWTVLVTAGNWTIVADIDPQNKVVETNTTNNSGSVKVSVLPAEELRPDVRLSAPTLSVREPRKGQTVDISVTVTNAGNAPAGGIVVTLVVDGAPVGTLNVPEIAAGSNRTVTLPWKADTGSRSIIYRAEGRNFNPIASTAVLVDVAAPVEEEGSVLPVLAVIGILVVAVLALLAAGAGKKQEKEEE
ncbi:MAG: hypothetical protein FJ149_04805 [Euryarchaeota archaeon]|nr:hypothetical protein [Euryarchaeota archaeon]